MYEGQTGRFAVPTISRLAVFTFAVVISIAMTPSSLAQTFQVIHRFTGGSDGGWPRAGLTMDGAGNLYGTAYEGGNTNGVCSLYGRGGCGTVFRLSRNGDDWTFLRLYAFRGNLDPLRDGLGPESSVVLGPGGLLYGTTEQGGGGYGTVFSLRSPSIPSRTNSWDETVIHRFIGLDGCCPRFGSVVFDDGGTLYLSTVTGGKYEAGTVVKLTRSSAGWIPIVLHTFHGGDGYYAAGGVILDKAGNLYGTTDRGGAHGKGTIFQVTPTDVGWTENVLYSFTGFADGEWPDYGLTFDEFGNLYGTTGWGYNPDGSGTGGTVFMLAPSDGAWTFTVLHTFNGPEGYYPSGGVIYDGNGSFYGTTGGGGAYGAGTVYKLRHTREGWVCTSIHDFTGGPDGAHPSNSLLLDAKGNLYGTTYFGGNGTCSWGMGCGIAFKITQ